MFLFRDGVLGFCPTGGRGILETDEYAAVIASSAAVNLCAKAKIEAEKARARCFLTVARDSMYFRQESR